MVGLLGNLFGAGTGGILGGGGGPLFGTNGQLAQFRQQNPNQWMNMAAGLLGGRTAQQSLANAAMGMAAGAPADQAAQEKAKRVAEMGKWIDAQQAAGVAIPPATVKLFSAYPELAEKFAVSQIMPETPKPTDDMREYDAARQQGFTGTLQDWITSNRKAGATNVNIGQGEVGTIPPGYELFTDPATKARSMRPIAGGPVDAEQKAAAAKAASTKQQAGKYADVVTQDIDRAIGIIETGSVPVTGMWSAAKHLPGTPAYDAAQLLNTIKANVGFDRLQEMRASSPTGGALGPVSDFENQLLQSTVGSLDQAQTQEQLTRNLRRVSQIYDLIVNVGIKPGDPLPDGSTAGAAPNGGTPAVGDWTDLGNGVRIRPRR